MKLRNIKSVNDSRRWKFQVNLLQNKQKKQEFQVTQTDTQQLLQDLKESDTESIGAKSKTYLQKPVKKNLDQRQTKKRSLWTR